MAKKIAKNPEVDPTFPKVPLTLGNQTYYLCFTFGALALAEARLRADGVSVNLLHSLQLDQVDATRLPALLYAAVLAHQPDATFGEVAFLVTLKTLGPIFDAIVEAYRLSLSDPSEEEKGNPTLPGLES
ncbi:MAG TPA: hypothetical protein VK638_30545 [Edaphobacter sp.]|nr:hypothetical protein [Edaphobacter sp.]